MKNHQSRPTGSTPFPEANGANFIVIKKTIVVDVVKKKNYRGQGERTYNSYKKKYFIPLEVEQH
jgi:hypothetical protein